MTNNTNIYDIDGELIRKAGDNHEWTIEEAKEKLEYYRKKLTEVGEDSPNAVKYATYMRNLSQYLMAMYAKMTPEQLNAELEKAKQETTDEQVKKAIEELKNSLEDEETTTDEPENKPLTQEDLLVERDEEPTPNDEYTPYEEVE